MTRLMPACSQALNNAAPRRQQGMDEVAADETTGAGYKNMHAVSPESVPVSVVPGRPPEGWHVILS